jgi:hypothetical protein
MAANAPSAEVMLVSFVRHRGQRDGVHVTRRDGTATSWDFPSYGDRLPHDLCHLVVERELGLAEGFWGFVDRGVDVHVVDDQATLVLGGKPLVEHLGKDFTVLMQAEEAVALLSPTDINIEMLGAITVAHLDSTTGTAQPIQGLVSELGFELPASATADAVDSIRQQLHALAERWRSIEDGEPITLAY